MAKQAQQAHMDEVKAYPEEYASDPTYGSMEALGDQIPPQIPGSVQATSKVGQVTVNWGSVPDNDFERYKVYYGTGTVNAATYTGTDTADTTSYEHASDKYGTNFTYRIRAIDYSGNKSDFSSSVYGSPSKAGTYDVESDVGEGPLGTLITETEISATAVSTPKLKANAVTTNKINAGAVTATIIAASAVQTNHLDASVITSSKITAGAIRTNELDTNAVTASKANIGTLSALTGNMGALNAGYISVSAGDVQIGENVTSGGADGIQVNSGGVIEITDANSNTVFNSSGVFQGSFVKTNSGTYTGNGNVERQISHNLGREPVAVFIQVKGLLGTLFHEILRGHNLIYSTNSSQDGRLSYSQDPLTSSYFLVGLSADMSASGNLDGAEYHWMAFG